MSVINTNITALIGQQNLGKSQGTLQTAMERLSSGLRINSAADDAAGQAIANRMTSQIDGLAQAQRNANDGISVAQTSEGALNQINENLQRIRELTVQAENGTNSSDDLASIQDEINLRLDEVDRIAEETSFNGVKVLADGESLTIQVGANDGETIQINLDSTNAEQLGLSGFSVTGPEGTTAAASNTQVEDVTGYDNVTSHTVTAFTAGDLDLSGGVTGSATTFADENGDLYAKVTVDGTALNSTDVEKLEAEGLDVDTSSATNEFYVALDSDDASLTGGTATFDATGSTELSDLTAARTASPLDKVDDALKAVDSQRSELGAIQNRFESAITNLSTTETNLSAARSRIEDADYAVEVSNLTRAQILQQAGTSVLAQANQVPQTALSLLG